MEQQTSETAETWFIGPNMRLSNTGTVRFGDVVSVAESRGNERNAWRNGGSHQPISSIPGHTSVSTSESKAGAECGNAARSDLCGGRPKPRGEGRPYRDRPNDVPKG